MIRMDSTMLHVGKVTNTFFDNLFIEQIQDVTRTVHSPEKVPGPLVKKDRPWEGVPYFTCNTWNVFRDEASGEFRCWYEDWHFDPQDFATHSRQDGGTGLPRSIHGDPYKSQICYARSEDGLNWVKPELDHLAVDGRKTNVVFGDPDFGTVHAATILDDPLESDPGKRYKVVYDRRFPDSQGKQIEIAHSGDGISWTPMDRTPNCGRFGPNLGDVLILTADVDSGLYCLTSRHPKAGGIAMPEDRPSTISFLRPIFPDDFSRMNRRRVFKLVSSDLIHWSLPQLILAPDDLDDNLDETFYGMAPLRMGDVYVGFLNVIHEVRNTLDVRLVYSRDGWNWRQLNQRQPWLAPSPDAWDRHMVNIPNVPVTVGDELFVYYGGAKNHHDWWITGAREELGVPEAKSLDEVGYGLGLAKLRKDRFVSLDAGSTREGILTTRPLHTEGDRLVLNAACGKGGSIEVEVTDAADRVLAGCSRAECDTFSGDSTQTTATWKGKPGIAHSGPLRLRFFMRDASLYSFAFK